MKFSQSSKSADFQLSEWIARRPILAIILVSLAALAINCYPIIFCGKSFVAPAVGLPMLYERYPTLPGMDSDAVPVQAHGSDTGGTLIWGVPVSFIESRSISQHGELPLWNRYSHCGDTLIGQAVSMFGDPLQLIVILGHGSSLAYDLKFLLSKLLFTIGFGLLIRRLIGSLPLALLFAAMAPYCSAFYYIFNHPVFFVFSYTPWILLSALEFLDLQSRYYFPWGLVWLLVNVGCFNGGHVESAVILIFGMNLAALAFALASNPSARAKIKILLRLALGTALFIALTAPMWLSFLATLPGSYSIHSQINVVQVHFASLLAAFDDVFFRLPVHPGPFTAPAPAASFLVFVGFTYSLIRWRALKHEVFFWVNLAALAFWGGCVFGWVPGWMISAIPMVNRIGHTHTDISYLLVIHLTIQCAYGFKCLARESNFRQVVVGMLGVGAILVGLTLLYCFGFEHGPIPWSYYIAVIAGAFAAPLLFAFFKSRGQIPLAGMAAVLVVGFIPLFRFGMYTFGNEYLLMIPQARVVFDAPSPAIETIKADQSAPFRVMGAQEILYGDYAAVYGLEGVGSCAPLSNKELVELIRAFPGIQSQTEWETELENPVIAHGLLNLFNVKYILTPPEISLQEGLGFRVAYTNDLGVLENLNVWPRAYFSDSVISLSSTTNFVNYLLTHADHPFAALTPEELTTHPELSALHTNANSAIVPATNYQLRVNSTAFDIHATSAGIVCLTEGQGRDFTATANGQSKPILTLNRAFKGIFLDKPGDYHVQFTYRPRHWRLACTLFWTAIGFIGILTCAAFATGQFKKMETPPNTDIPMP